VLNKVAETIKKNNRPYRNCQSSYYKDADKISGETLLEKNLITKENTDGLDLSWGNDESIIKLIHQIAHREGFGDLLGEGVRKASAAIPGSERFALHVKGMATPAQEVFVV